MAAKNGNIKDMLQKMSSRPSTSNGDMNGENAKASGDKPAKGTLEAKYQKKSQIEHVLLRPDTYIGSLGRVTELMWVYDAVTNSMVQRELTYVPGLYKIFDEIVVNAADNKQRDPSMNCIKINIDPEDNVISVWNNGKGVEVEMHKEENMYVPTLIFGHLLTSSNYDDDELRVTGGRNGFGAKLTNIYSTKFTVETGSKDYKKQFKQTWTNNMTKASTPVIKEGFKDFTKVTFSPDLQRFGMEKLDKDMVDLMSRRAYDIAASSKGVKVYLNDSLVPVKNFKEYVDLYTKNKVDDMGGPLKIVYDDVNPRWEIAVTMSEKGFQQISFVNSIATTKGGQHVDYVADMIIKKVIDIIKKRNKGGVQIKNFQVKNHLWVFVNCLIPNPSFESQTKQTLGTEIKKEAKKYSLPVFSEKFVAAVTKTGIIESVLSWAKFKEQTQLQKKSGNKKTKLKGVPKLEDANDAGSKHSIDCTLILTEGDSAKSLAVSGLGVVGRDKFGVFPLRGKLLNVREASHKQIMENAEINNIVKIVGLQYKKKYETMEDLKTLRYGRLMIMTDQDQDGSHIKGLIINFIHHNWPSLLRLPFLEEFITPIIKATKSKEELSFFSIPEFEEWKASKDNWHTYKIKYYKGLGTSTSKEAKEYFSNMARHRILFKHRGDDDDSHITMAFSKKMVDARKEWLTNWMTESKRRKELGLGDDYLYAKDTRAVTYKDFINKELVLFSNMDNERSIPSLIDGLKPGSRKVLYTCLKRNDKREIKVAQLAGSVAEHSAYHHGEMSLMSTIINLAQNYVGSNNINLLQPIGQFGTRLQGGKDAASPRYIFTMLSPLTRLIFHPHDDPLLKYLRDDNLKIEPVWYMPIIPMVLVNGADGIGTGWMTKIPNHNPREIAENLKKMIRGEEPTPMKPWYKNFLGEIDSVGDTRFVTNGEISILSDDKLEITELPIGTWTQAYKESVLEVMLHGNGDKIPATINEYKEYNTDTTVKFIVSMARDKLYSAEREGLHKFFKLQGSMSISSMCAFDKDSVLKKYDNTLQILREFYAVRLDYYQKRKAYLEGMLQAEALKLTNQARFIVEKCDGDLRIENRKKKEMIAELIRREYDSDPVRLWKIKQDKESALEDDEAVANEEEGAAEGEEQADSKEDYEYLLGMKLWSLTLEKKTELLKKRDEKQAELKALQQKSPKDLWNDDLDALLIKLDEVEQQERDEENSTKPVKGKLAKLGKKKQPVLTADSLPSPHGRRIQPRIDDDMIKKVEKAQAAKENKGKRAAKKLAKENGEVEVSPDGSEVTTKKAASKAKPKKDVQPKTKTTPTKSKKKGGDIFDDSDEESDDSDFGGESLNTTPIRSTSRRAAASNVKFTYSDSSSSEKEEMDVDGGHSNVDENVMDMSSELEGPSSSSKISPIKKKIPKKKQDSDSDDLFVASESSDDELFLSESKKKKPSPKKAKETKKKPQETKKQPAKTKETSDVTDKSSKGKKKYLSTESEEITPQPSTSKQAKKRAIFSSSDSESDIFKKKTDESKDTSSDAIFDSLLEKPKRKATKTTKKTMLDDDDESDAIVSSESEDDYKPTSKKTKGNTGNAKGPGKKSAPKKKRKYSDSDSD